MTKPHIKIEMTRHPDARDGQPNAWKIEMREARGELLMVETAETAEACLDEAKLYINGTKAQVTIKIDSLLAKAWLDEPVA